MKMCGEETIQVCTSYYWIFVVQIKFRFVRITEVRITEVQITDYLLNFPLPTANMNSQISKNKTEKNNNVNLPQF